MLWRALLGPARRKRIGIAWSGGQRIPGRSIPLATLAPLFRRTDCEFHALQAEIPQADCAWLAGNPALVDHTAKLVDFADTAALASCMDLIITIDTSTVHLAGALGLPTWIMLPFHVVLARLDPRDRLLDMRAEHVFCRTLVGQRNVGRHRPIGTIAALCSKPDLLSTCARTHSSQCPDHSRWKSAASRSIRVVSLLEGVPFEFAETAVLQPEDEPHFVI